MRLRAFHFEDSNQFLEACTFGVEDAAAQTREAIVAAASVVKFARGTVAGFFDETFFDQALEGAVERGGPEADFAIGAVEDFLHDAVAMLFVGGKGEEDMEPVGFEGEEVFGFRHWLIYILIDT